MNKGFAASEPHGFWLTKKEIHVVKVMTSKIPKIPKMTEIYGTPEKSVPYKQFPTILYSLLD